MATAIHEMIRVTERYIKQDEKQLEKIQGSIMPPKYEILLIIIITTIIANFVSQIIIFNQQ